MASELQIVTVKLPKAELRRFPPGQSRSDFIRAAVSEKLEKSGKPRWQPKTALGRKLLSLSERFEGELLDSNGIAKELRERRGGLY
jgi:hypothetical protein